MGFSPAMGEDINEDTPGKRMLQTEAFRWGRTGEACQEIQIQGRVAACGLPDSEA